MGFAPADALLSGVTRDDKGLPNNYLEGGGGGGKLEVGA